MFSFAKTCHCSENIRFEISPASVQPDGLSGFEDVPAKIGRGAETLQKWVRREWNAQVRTDHVPPVRSGHVVHPRITENRQNRGSPIHIHPAVLKHVKVKRINLKGVRSQCDQTPFKFIRVISIYFFLFHHPHVSTTTTTTTTAPPVLSALPTGILHSITPKSLAFPPPAFLCLPSPHACFCSWTAVDTLYPISILRHVCVLLLLYRDVYCPKWGPRNAAARAAR